MIHRAVGTNGDRLIAVGIVTGPPVEERVDLWGWRLPRRITHLCTAVDVAPRAAEVGISAHAMRTFKELDAEAGQRARKAIEAVAEPWSS